MAEYIFKDLVQREIRDSEFYADSAAASREELGNPVYPPAKKTLEAHGITNITHRARQFTKSDYKTFDKIYVMDNYNLTNILPMCNSDPERKISLLLGNEEIEDPWYTGSFEKVYKQIERGCKQILNTLKNTDK